MSGSEQDPPVVTFKTGAELLMRREIVKSITARGVRYIAETHKEWPFGPGRKHAYGQVSNAKVMDTGPFLEFFRKHPPSGRGPAKKPGETGGAP